jgi:hypothetical protein
MAWQKMLASSRDAVKSQEAKVAREETREGGGEGRNERGERRGDRQERGEGKGRRVQRVRRRRKWRIQKWMMTRRAGGHGLARPA